MPEPEVRCPQCAAPVPAGAVRCGQCGTEVPTSPSATGIESWFTGPEPPPWAGSPPPAQTPPPLPPEATQPPPLPAEPTVEIVEEAEPPPPADAGDILILDEPAPVGPAPAPEPPEVPVVRPARRSQRLDDLPEAQPLPSYRRPTPTDRPASQPPARSMTPVRPPLPPVRDHDPTLPKPRIFLAMFILLAMTVAFACGLSVILYAIYAGLKASRPGKAEAAPAVVVPCDRGPGRVA